MEPFADAWRVWVVTSVVLGVLVSGCLAGGGSPSTVSTATEEPSATDPPTTGQSTDGPSTTSTPPQSLDSRLYRLTTAGNQTAYAAQHGLSTRDGRVLVVVELVEGTALPAGFEIETELSRGNEVLGYVRIDRLTAVATAENVSRVRPPERGATAQLTGLSMERSPQHTR